jgi:hypothetical protein
MSGESESKHGTHADTQNAIEEVPNGVQHEAADQSSPQPILDVRNFKAIAMFGRRSLGTNT